MKTFMFSAKRRYKYAIGLVIGCIAILLGFIVLYLVNTSKYEDLRTYFVEYSEIGSEEFTPYGLTGLEDYLFCVSETKTEPAQQELYIIQNKKLFGLFNFGRYEIIQHEVSSVGQIVGTASLELEGKQKAVIFFSSNPNGITSYEIEFQENGKFGILQGGVSQEEAFVVGILELGSGKYLHRVYDAVLFYDEENNVVELLGRRKR